MLISFFRLCLPLLFLLPLSLAAQIIGFSNPNVQIVEDSLLLQVPVFLSLPDNDTTRVSVQIGAGGTADNGDDFSFSSQQLTWLPNDSSVKLVPLRIFEDQLVEYDETLNLRLVGPTNGAVLVDSQYNLQIQDDDPLEISFQGAGQTIIESGDTALFYVTLNGQPRQNIDFSVQRTGGNAQLGSDFIWMDGNFSFPANDSSRIPLRVVAIEDQINEGNEQVIIDLLPSDTSLLVDITAYTVTIIDNDSLGTGWSDPELLLGIYPNPVSDFLILNEVSLISVDIFTSSGLHVFTIENDEALGLTTIDVGSLSPGQYLLMANFPEGHRFGRFIKR
jgi:hypothetical protein